MGACFVPVLRGGATNVHSSCLSAFHENTEGMSTDKASRLPVAKPFINRLAFATFHGTR